MFTISEMRGEVQASSMELDSRMLVQDGGRDMVRGDENTYNKRVSASAQNRARYYAPRVSMQLENVSINIRKETSHDAPSTPLDLATYTNIVCSHTPTLEKSAPAISHMLNSIPTCLTITSTQRKSAYQFKRQKPVPKCNSSVERSGLREMEVQPRAASFEPAVKDDNDGPNLGVMREVEEGRRECEASVTKEEDGGREVVRTGEDLCNKTALPSA